MKYDNVLMGQPSDCLSAKVDATKNKLKKEDQSSQITLAIRPVTPSRR